MRDFDRPLAPRGRRAAPRIATWLLRKDYVPDLVLCSAAKRAVETWDRLRTALAHDAEVQLLHDLYAAQPARILDIVRGRGGDAESVLVIGHNPGMHELAHHVVHDGPAADLRRLRQKFPTAAAAVIDFDIDQWPDAQLGRLTAFIRPKDL